LGAYAGNVKRLTDKEKDDLSRRLADGEPIAALAREFNVSRPTIYHWKRIFERALTPTSAAQRSPGASGDRATTLDGLRRENEMLKEALAELYVEKVELERKLSSRN
tara:strand:- start:4532 stop:4852 length:321 start_codon:yes stop_codon:yes gene_type:complete